jgi:hypothetical protein
MSRTRCSASAAMHRRAGTQSPSKWAPALQRTDREAIHSLSGGITCFAWFAMVANPSNLFRKPFLHRRFPDPLYIMITISSKRDILRPADRAAPGRYRRQTARRSQPRRWLPKSDVARFRLRTCRPLLLATDRNGTVLPVKTFSVSPQRIANIGCRMETAKWALTHDVNQA